MQQLRDEIDAAPLETFARLHTVQDKVSKRPIPFNPMPMQRKIFDAVAAGHKRIAVIKARQVAATTGCKMVLHQMASTTKYAALHAVVSMRSDSATMLMDDHKRWLRDMPEPLRRKLSINKSNHFTFDDTGAGIKAFTSRSSTGLRSFSPSAALVSEFAFAPDQEEVLAQADAAVGDEGLLIIESTANNPGDRFSEILTEAPGNGWHVISMWWWEHPAYTVTDDEVTADFEASLTKDERAIKALYGLTLNQLVWRRSKALSLGEHKFKREYPACLDDCFLQRKGAYFEAEALAGISVRKGVETDSHGGCIIELPEASDYYVAGSDVGGGVGGDNSTICIISASTRQPVYFLQRNDIAPKEWANVLVQVCTRYNTAQLLVESNNHGHAVLLALDYHQYRNLWLNPLNGKPWNTSLPSKLEIYATLRAALPLILGLDARTWAELRALTIPAGKIAPEAPKGGYDDAAIAVALGYRCLRDVPSAWLAPRPKATVNPVQAHIRTNRRRRSASLPF